MLGKHIGHLTQSIKQLGPLWVFCFMRQEARVEGDQFQIVVARQRRHRLGVFQVGFPVFVGSKASGLGDRFERGIVLPYRFHHAAFHRDVCILEHFEHEPPDIRSANHRRQGQLHAAQTAGSDFLHQILGIGGLQTPRTDGQSHG